MVLPSSPGESNASGSERTEMVDRSRSSRFEIPPARKLLMPERMSSPLGPSMCELTPRSTSSRRVRPVGRGSSATIGKSAVTAPVSTSLTEMTSASSSPAVLVKMRMSISSSTKATEIVPVLFSGRGGPVVRSSPVRRTSSSTPSPRPRKRRPSAMGVRVEVKGPITRLST